LNEIIAGAETKIAQAQTQLVGVIIGLSASSLMSKAFEDALKSFDKTIDSLTDVRKQLGKTSRSLQSDLKNQINLDQPDEIVQAYIENI
jgi:hypothetical protein